MIYFVVDTAADSGLFNLVTASPDHMCLFAGPLRTALERNAPYVVELNGAGRLIEAWKARGRGHNWGILCRSERGLAEVRRELRRSLQAKLPDGRIVLFRFYDPRVWRTYVHSCSPPELERWFGTIDAFYADAEPDQDLLEYRFDGAGLAVTPVNAAALL